MRILLASFLTFMAIHLSTLSVNAKESSFVYVQLMYRNLNEHHDIRQWNYEAFRERDKCENDLMKQLKKADGWPLEDAKAEFVARELVVSNYGGLVALRCIQIYPVVLQDFLFGGS